MKTLRTLRTFVKDHPGLAFVVFPSIGGATLGSFVGGYNGFITSRKDDYAFNVFGTAIGIIAGTSIGTVIGVLLPISIMVGIMRTIHPQKNSSKKI